MYTNPQASTTPVRLHWRAFTIAIMLAGSMLLQSCSSRPPMTLASSNGPPAQHTRAAETMRHSAPAYGCGTQVPVSPATADAEVVVVEVATDVSVVGRRIWLGEAKNDIWMVTITDGMVVRDAHGQPARLEDIPAGSCIQAGGRAGRVTELIASWIVIVDSPGTVADPAARSESARILPARYSDARDQERQRMEYDDAS